MQIVSNGDNLQEMLKPIFWETISMKCQNPFSGKNKKNINVSSAELSQRVVKANLIAINSNFTILWSAFS